MKKQTLILVLLALLTVDAGAAEKKPFGRTAVCRDEAATKYEVKTSAVAITKYDVVKGGYYVLQGFAKLEDGSKEEFKCTFDKKQNFIEVETL